MTDRIRPTRAGLFAIELLIAVAVFTLCAAFCGGLFVHAEVMSRDNEELNRAVNEARSVAECFKASGGDLTETAALTGGGVEDDTLLLTLDGGMTLQLAVRQEEGYVAGDLTVTGDGGQLLAWDVAALEGTS